MAQTPQIKLLLFFFSNNKLYRRTVCWKVLVELSCKAAKSTLEQLCNHSTMQHSWVPRGPFEQMSAGPAWVQRKQEQEVTERLQRQPQVVAGGVVESHVWELHVITFFRTMTLKAFCLNCLAFPPCRWRKHCNAPNFIIQVNFCLWQTKCLSSPFLCFLHWDFYLFDPRPIFIGRTGWPVWSSVLYQISVEEVWALQVIHALADVQAHRQHGVLRQAALPGSQVLGQAAVLHVLKDQT